MPYRQADSPQKIGSPVSPACAGELGGQPSISQLTTNSLPFPGRMSMGKSSLSPADTVNFSFLPFYFHLTSILLTSIYLYSTY